MYTDVSFALSALSLGTVPEHKKGKPKSIIIDDLTSGAKTIIFHDVFTPDASNGTASPTAQTKTWFQVTSPGNVTLNYDESALAGIELLGAVDVSSNVASPLGNIAYACIYE